MSYKIYTDQMGCTVSIKEPIQSIVSLVPSQTELLYDLGVGHLIKGVTKFCVHPANKVKTVIKVGGTKQFHFDVIDELKPDLIIGNKEENYEEGIEKLKDKYPVWMSDIYTLYDAKQMIKQISILVSREAEGQKLLMEIDHEFSLLNKKEAKKVIYFIWKNPYMAVGKNTFIDHMLTTLGLENIAPGERYPEVSEEKLQALNPDLILLSSEPYPFKAKHSEELLNICPKAELHIVDGEMFSWYGSRLKKAPAYFNSLNF